MWHLSFLNHPALRRQGRTLLPLRKTIVRDYSVRNNKVSDDFRIGGLLGTGSFASVFEAQNVDDGKFYAVKSVPKHYSPGYNALNEATNLERVSHENVCQMKAIYEDSSHYHLVTELCQGGELFDRIIRKGKYSESSAIRVVTQIMGAVAACHAASVVHRDIKPENILCKSDADICSLTLTDFGSSTRIDSGQELTQFVGSAAYVAPEVLLGRYNEKCDIWSVGVIAYMLLCGRTPWRGESARQVALSVLEDPIDLLSPPWHNISTAGKEFVAALLQRDVSLRPSAETALQHPWLQSAARLKLFDKADLFVADSLSGGEPPIVPLWGERSTTTPTGVRHERSHSFPLDEAMQNIFEFQRNYKLRQLALKVTAASLCENARVDVAEEMRTSLKAVDLDEDGLVSLHQVSRMIEERSHEEVVGHAALKHRLSLEEEKFLGQVDIDEFVAAAVSHKMQSWKRSVIELFMSIDVDRDGKISTSELAVAAPHLNLEDIENIINFADFDHDGVISYQEFVLAMNKLPKHAEPLEWAVNLLAASGAGSDLVDNAHALILPKTEVVTRPTGVIKPSDEDLFTVRF